LQEEKILEMAFIFVGAIVGMGCFTGIIVTSIKHLRRKQLPAPDIMLRLDEIAERMNRMETAIDATALEVERIAEGQRFTTRLLADRAATPVLPDKARPGGSTTPH